MIEFFLMFEKWTEAEHAAARAECRLSHGLDSCCEGLGPAPALAVVAEAKQLRSVANERLRRLWKLAWQARSRVPVI